MTKCIRRITKSAVCVATTAATLLTAAAVAGAGSPTCSGIVGEVHGHHVVADYVDGEGHDTMTWPPRGQVDAAGGAAAPGAPGAHGHMPAGIAPGASFCIPQASSPGFPH